MTVHPALELIPPGTVIAYAGPVDQASASPQTSQFPNPQRLGYSLRLERMGWLVCDGRAVPLAKYYNLFLHIGFIYGKGDSAGEFLLPDYRGRFHRGVSAGAADRDPDADDRTASGEGGWEGDQVGSLQEDAFQTHTHPYDKAVALPGLGANPGGAFNAHQQPSADTGAPSSPARVADETRPKNVYVNYLIYAGAPPSGCGAALEETYLFTF